MSDPLAEIRKRFDELYGPELIAELLKVKTFIPDDWMRRAPDHGFEYLRCRLRYGQAELGWKSGMDQARVSRIEGGADVRLSVWKRLYAAMGFDVVLVPVTTMSLEELQDFAASGRSAGYWRYERARPRRRWRAAQQARMSNLT